MNRRTLTVQLCAKQYKLGEAFRKLWVHRPMFVQCLEAAIDVFQPYPLAICISIPLYI